VRVLPVRVILCIDQLCQGLFVWGEGEGLGLGLGEGLGLGFMVRVLWLGFYG
jgi:hypothetical protein